MGALRVTTMPDKDLFTSGEIGRLCGIPARTARRYLNTGVIPAKQHPLTGRWKVSREAILQFLKEHGMSTGQVQVAGAHRILIIDDEEWVVSFVKEVVEAAFPAARVEGFTDSHQACLRLGTFQPSLVILDLRMPTVDGRQLLAALRAQDVLAKVPVLVISGYPDDFPSLQAVKNVAFLAKPFDDYQLMNAILPLLPS